METVYIIVRGPSKHTVFTSYEEARLFCSPNDRVRALSLHNGKATARKLAIESEIAELQAELNSL